jgi:MFS family permease
MVTMAPDQQPAESHRWQRRLGGFGLLWSSSAVSSLGDGLRITVLPLLAVAATSDPRQIAVVATAGLLPWPLLGLLSGVIADRVDRRRAMWLVDAARAVMMLGFAAWIATGAPTIALLAAVAFFIGAGHTVYDSAATGLLPSLVCADRLPYANSRLVTTTMLTGQLLGPAVAGLLFAVAPELPLGIDAGSFLVAALLVAVIRVPPTHGRSSPRARTRVRTDIREGLVALWRDRTLRTMTALIAVLAGVSGALAALLVLYAKQRLHLGSTGYGLLFCCYAIGGLVGSVSAPMMLKAGSAVRPLIVVLTLTVGSFAGLAATTTVIAAVIALIAFGVAVGLWYVLSASMFQTHAPSALLGRVSSAYRTTAVSAAALGSVCAGFTADAVGIANTLLACALLVAGAGLLNRNRIAAAQLTPPLDGRHGARARA